MTGDFYFLMTGFIFSHVENPVTRQDFSEFYEKYPAGLPAGSAAKKNPAGLPAGSAAKNKSCREMDKISAREARRGIFRGFTIYT